MRQPAAATLLLLFLVCTAAPAQRNLVGNGNFEADVDNDGIPDRWATAGAEQVKQVLRRDAGRDGKGFAAKLECTAFESGVPSSHAMLGQVGVVSVQRGKWYRLTLWARGEGITGREVKVGLSNTNPWGSAGLSDAVTVSSQWKRHEVLFKATADLPAETSRLQFWFNSTGTLWMDDVELAETDVRPQWHPQLVTEGRTNTVPNSSFECGPAGWGSFAPDLTFWGGNMYALLGEVDASTAAHGKHSLRMDLSEKRVPTYFFDYLDPVRHRARTVITAHAGWLPAQRGQSYTLSASLKADVPGRVGVLFVQQAGNRSLRKEFPLTTEWQRYTFSFPADAEFLWAGVGTDLLASKADAAVVWVDALQLEKGAEATPYRPATPIEAMLSSETPGNFFPVNRGRAGLRLRLHAFNNGAARQTTRAALTVTNFADAEVLRRTLPLSLPAGGSTVTPVDLQLAQKGFFRVHLAVEDRAPHQQVRCLAFPRHQGSDSRFGVNHAYPWDFLLPLAHQAGILWWRDWTTQWRTVQPRAGAPFDFREPDAQIDRVLRQRGNVLALFPFPSTDWCSTADEAALAKVARSEGARKRVTAAFKPKDEAAFSEYVTRSARHYRDRVQVFQVFNEPLYTNYSLPAASGHTIEDYVRLLRLANAAVKAQQPTARVLGGMGIWADSKWTTALVEAGGLKHLDALDLHLYPRGDPESFGESLAKLRRRMKERGEERPVWVTELGCYADDDLAVTPLAGNFGDEAMRRSLHAGEREASEWLVKFCALIFANGGERIFLHAGTCGEFNGVDAAGVFFEYGGAPRKMLAAVAVMSGLLPPEARFEKREALGENAAAYWFTTPAGRVAVAWATDGTAPLPAGVQVLDLMGNPMAKPGPVGGAPVYLRR